MIAIYAEKPDIARKVAAALDGITIGNGYKVKFDELNKYDKQVKATGMTNGYYAIKFKGEECFVTWGIGHLTTLKQAFEYNPDYKNWKKLPIPFFPDKWELKVIESTKEQFNKAKEVLKKADYIINSTDDDREGELLFAYAYEKMGIKTPYKYRAKFSIQTKDGIKDAFDNLIDAKLCKNTENAGRGRSIADAAIGWNCSAQQTIAVNSSEVISVGRCQTPTLNMVVERELEIRNFKSEDYFVLEAKFIKDGIEFKGEHIKGKFKTKKDAEDILVKLNGNNGIVTKVEKKDMVKEVPGLYNIDLIQMDANSKYGLTADVTLKIVQSLYEKGYVTYPRTDSVYLNEGMENTVNDVLDNLAKNNPEYNKLITGRTRGFAKSKKYFDDKKVTSHFATIPTSVNPVNMTSDEAKVYDLIARSVIRMVYNDAIIEKTNVVISVNGEEFKASGNSIKELEWYAVDGTPKENLLPTLVINDNVDGTYSVVSKKTEPPKRYTDKTLIAAMKNVGKEIPDNDLRKFMASHNIEGIGRPSTRAEIINKLIKSGYIKRDKKSIVATDKGIEVIKLLPFDEIKSAELTAKWEQKLSDIEDGKMTLDTFIKEIKALTTDWCLKIKGNTANQTSSLSNTSNSGNGSGSNATKYKCKLCGAVLNEYNWGFGCSNYKSGCKFSIGKIAYEKKLTQSEIKDLLTKGETSRSVRMLKYDGRIFDSKLCIKPNGKVGCKK